MAAFTGVMYTTQPTAVESPAVPAYTPWTPNAFVAAPPLPVIRVKIWDTDTSKWITPPSS